MENDLGKNDVCLNLRPSEQEKREIVRMNRQISERMVKMSQFEIVNMAQSFIESSILFALFNLGIFEIIGQGDRKISEIADDLHINSETLIRLMNAGVSLDLLETDDCVTYRLTERSRSVLLPSAKEYYIGDGITNLQYLSDALHRLDEAVQTSSPSINVFERFQNSKGAAREFSLAMHNYASLRAKELASFLDTTGVGTLLDLGCGPGTFAYHLGLKSPNIELNLLDLPEVLEFTEEIYLNNPINNDVKYIPIDFFKEEIPGCYDMVLVSNTLHMLGEEASRKLINRLYNSVNVDGSLVIQAQFIKDEHFFDRWPIYLDLIQLCITPRGRNHTVSETIKWMEEAGFQDIQYQSMTFTNPNSFIRGFKFSSDQTIM